MTIAFGVGAFEPASEVPAFEVAAEPEHEEKLTEVQLQSQVRQLHSKVINWIEASFTPEKDDECRRKGFLTTDMVVNSSPQAMNQFLRFIRASFNLSHLNLQCQQCSRGHEDFPNIFKIRMTLTAENRGVYASKHPECLLRQGMLTNITSPKRTPRSRRKRPSGQKAHLDASPSMGELLDRISHEQVAGANVVAVLPTPRSDITPSRRAKRASADSTAMTPVLDQPRSDQTRQGDATLETDSASKKAEDQSTDNQDWLEIPKEPVRKAARTDGPRIESDVTPAKTALATNIGESLSISQMQSLLQRFIDDRRATGGPFENTASASGSITISSEEARRVMNAYNRGDGELADELTRLHMVVLSSGAELNAEWKQRCVRRFKGLVAWQCSQGSFVLGHPGAARGGQGGG